MNEKKVRKTSGIQWKIQNKMKRKKLGGGEGEIKPTNKQCKSETGSKR